MDFFSVLLAQDEQTARRETQQQNAARLAFHRHTHASSGVGTVRIPAPIVFDAPFLERPHFVQGASVKTAADPTVWNLPVGSAGLWQWQRNVKGHYVGAFVYLDVRMGTLNGDILDYPAVEMLHDLLFVGVAYKDLGDAVSTEAQIVAPRTVNFGSI